MKKLFMVIAVMAILMLPFTSFAMTSIEDSDLSTVTGQAGVSINLDANIHLEVATAAWGDKDGLGAATANGPDGIAGNADDGKAEASGAGWIGVSNINANIRVRADQTLLQGAWAGTVQPGDPVFGSLYPGLAIGALQAKISDGIDTALAGYAYYGPLAISAVDNWRNAAPANEAAFGALTFSAGFNYNDPKTWTATDITAMQGLDPATLGTPLGYVDAVRVGYATADGQRSAFYSVYTQTLYDSIGAASDEFKPLTIDVATDSGTGHGVANTTFVRIGLGSLEVVVSSINVPVALGDGAAIPNLNQTLGSLYMSGLTIRILGSSYVDIYNGRATGQGVTLGLNVTLKEFGITKLSWGDIDGVIVPNLGIAATDTTKAGYVGLENLTIAGLTVAGKVNIDVATLGSTAGTWMPANTTFVRIGLGNSPADPLALIIGALNADVVLGNSKELTAGNGPDGLSGTDAQKLDDTKVYTLGSLYMSATTINLSGYADIYSLAGKQGVAIDFNVSIPSLTINTLSWGDADGLPAINALGGVNSPAYAAAGYVGLKDLTIAGLNLSGNAKIDVATVEAGNTLETTYGVGRTFVRIGLNDINVHIGDMNAKVALGQAKNALSEELGSVYMSTLNTDIDGYVDIMSAKRATVGDSQGVVINMAANVSSVNIAALSWGDDNLDTPLIGGAGATAGYVGLRSLAIGAMKILGQVTIDVATINPGLVPSTMGQLMYACYATHNLSPTFVHLGLGTGDASIDPSVANGQLLVNIASLAATVALDSVPGLNTVGAGALGSLYLGTVNVGINGWVDIAAH